MRYLPALALLVMPVIANADALRVEKAMVPLAPPGVMAHAAFMTISNDSEKARQLIGVKAEGYAMAHIHQTAEKDGVMTMSAVDLVEIAPGGSVAFKNGGLHVMLMKPTAPKKAGDAVTLKLEFADGEVLEVSAKVMRQQHGS